jgi:hypothetical protein
MFRDNFFCPYILYTNERGTGYELRVSGCGLRCAGYEVRVASYGFRGTECGFRVTNYGLRGAGR